MVRYVVTTEVDCLPRSCQIFMVDGTVPGWRPGVGDHLWDHHRPGGAPIQIEEMPLPTRSLLLDFADDRDPCLATTMLDADACAAAAWVQLERRYLDDGAVVRRLRALAWDCDHLRVPPELGELGDWALAAGSALHDQKDAIAMELGLSTDRAAWTATERRRCNALGFERYTDWLVAAARGERPWPGDAAAVERVRAAVAAMASRLVAEGRVQFVMAAGGAIAVCDGRGIRDGVDPRAFYRALDGVEPPAPLRPEALTIRDRPEGGTAYTLGSIPLHPLQASLDFTLGTFEALTAAERQQNPEAGPWGGRKTVGGSPWNTPSVLTPSQVVAAINRVRHRPGG